MPDLFDNVILCRQCGKEMQKETIVKNGASLRSAHCEKCHKREFHPLDLERFKEFQELRQRPFKVKLRMVGNSYAVSIPREIIDFFEEADRMVEEVEMQFSEFDKLMLSFHQRSIIRRIPSRSVDPKQERHEREAKAEKQEQVEARTQEKLKEKQEKREKVYNPNSSRNTPKR